MLEQKNVTVKAGSSFQTICPFPVGYIYQSYNSTSSANIYGGSWTPITGRFLYCNSGTGTGGSNTHTHGLSSGYGQMRYDVQNAPNLQIGLRNASWTNSTGLLYEWGWSQIARAITGSLNAGINAQGMALGGNTNTSSNIPAYQTCYAWRRTN